MYYCINIRSHHWSPVRHETALDISLWLVKIKSSLLCRHQAREAEPKDYDIKDYQPQKRNLHNSTYHRIGNVTDGVSLVIFAMLHGL